MKDLPKVPTWRLERDSNPRPSSRTVSPQPMRHHVQSEEVIVDDKEAAEVLNKYFS